MPPRKKYLVAKMKYQSGQSMVEYVVVLSALMAALYAVTDEPGAVGMNKNQDPSLMHAIHQRYSNQNFALRLTQIPPSDAGYNFESIRGGAGLSNYEGALNKIAKNVTGKHAREELNDYRKSNIFSLIDGMKQQAENLLKKFSDAAQLTRQILNTAINEFIKYVPRIVPEIIKDLVNTVINFVKSIF